jgi:hypothetical protein
MICIKSPHRAERFFPYKVFLCYDQISLIKDFPVMLSQIFQTEKAEAYRDSSCGPWLGIMMATPWAAFVPVGPIRGGLSNKF